MSKKKVNLPVILSELLIVFIGVYGAFELNRFQQNKRDKKIQVNYFMSFDSELNKLISDIESVKEKTETLIKQYEETDLGNIELSLRPPNLIFHNSMLITQAGFNADIFTQLDASLASSLSGGFDNVMVATKEIERFNDQCQKFFTPYLKLNEDNYQELDWYVSDLKMINSRMQLLSGMMVSGAKPAITKIIEDLN